MKKALLFFVLFLVSCGGGGADGIRVMPLDWQYGKATTEWSIYGDSSAQMLTTVWKEYYPQEPVTGYGIAGAGLKDMINAPDKYQRKKAVWLIGGNDVQGGRSTDDIVEDYFRILTTYKAERVYCVGLTPQFKQPWANAQIEEINGYIKGMCGQGYVDSWALYQDGFLMEDNLHHTEEYDIAIITEILRLDAEWDLVQ